MHRSYKLLEINILKAHILELFTFSSKFPKVYVTVKLAILHFVSSRILLLVFSYFYRVRYSIVEQVGAGILQYRYKYLPYILQEYYCRQNLKFLARLFYFEFENFNTNLKLKIDSFCSLKLDSSSLSTTAYNNNVHNRACN